jgi:predicted CXXCH cytochrome family protein
VERRLAGLDPPENEPDPGVVNPIHLDRTGQIAVCQQCHLSGVTVFRQNENPTTFRPGQRLSDHRIVYVPEDQLTDPERFGISSHAMRLAQSKCYEQSTMTCTTCHDPHQPVATMGLEAFNTTCRSCHDSASRLQQSSESAPSCSAIADMQSGDCVSCHMQKSGTSDIPHVTFTDHWIRRTLPAPRQPDEIKRILVKQDPVELVRVLDLQDEQVSGDQAMMELEAAIAYSEYYETRHRLPSYLPRIIDSARKGLAGGADHPEARLALGKALIELDSLPVAEHVLREAITRFPEHVLIQYWLGDALYRQGKTELSISHLQAAIELQPNLIAAYIKLAEAQQVEGDFSSARQNLEEALQRDPIHHPEAWNNLGMIHFQSAHYDDAVRSFRQATNLDPDLVQAWVNLGAVYLMLEQFDDAIEVLQFAIESDPNFAPTFGNLGYIYMQQGDFDQARIMFNKVLELQPDDERARAYLDQLSGR